MDILIAFGVVAAIGLIAAVMLALASHFFGVKEDETVQNIRACLPGANCGACGCAGCDEYAKALAAGSVKANLCIPGGVDTANSIAAILGIEVEAPLDLVAFVRCNGNCDAATKKAAYVGTKSCVAAAALFGGENVCVHGCLGCGDCAEVCPVDAICMKDGIAHVDTSTCIGCGMCVRTCPRNIISLVPQDVKTLVMCSSTDKGAVARKACKNACIACKKCANSCPSEAITVDNNLARIDYDKCTRCGICAEVCPTGAIKALNLYAGITGTGL